jgi:hypothetical protein
VADTQAGAKAGKKPQTKTLLIVGAVVVVGGYLWLKSRQNAQQGQGTAHTGQGGGGTTATTYGLGPGWLSQWNRDHQGQPRHRPRHHRRRGGRNLPPTAGG